MANKKKTTGYVPEPIDGDQDGFVQDGTEWERPAETELETPEAPEESALTYLVKGGENILTVADKFKPEGVSRGDYAKTLASLNGTVTPGRVVRLG